MSKRNIFKVSFILGTRPEAIKLAPLIKRFVKSEDFSVKVILSGQHDQMVSQVMKIFKLKEDINLGMLKKCHSIDDLTSEIIKELSKIFSKEKPD